MNNLISISGKISSGKDTVASIIQAIEAWRLIKEEGEASIFHGDATEKQFILDFIDPNNITYKKQKWQIKRFADKIKDTICLWLGCSREQLEDREFKEKHLGEEWHVWWTQHRNGSKKIFSSESNRDGYLAHLNETNYQKWEDTGYGDYRLTPRKLLQLLGTECGRNIIHPSIWVNALFADYQPKYIRTKDNKEVPVGNYEYYQNNLDSSADKVIEKYPNWIIPDTRFHNEIERVDKLDGLKLRVERDRNKRLPELAGLTVSKKELHPSETSLDDYDDWDYVVYNNYSMKTLIQSVKEILEDEDII